MLKFSTNLNRVFRIYFVINSYYMYIIERNTGKTEVWIGKSEKQYGKYEISGLLKIIVLLVIVGFSLFIGSFL